MTKVYVTKVEMIDGQVSIVFPPGFIEKLDLVDGQFLLWEIADDKIIIRKKVESTNAQ